MTEKTALKLWLQLAKTSTLMQQQVNTRLRSEYGQSMARFDVLSQLARTDGRFLSVGELSTALIASSGNITRLLDRMQNEGLLDRKPAPGDLRSVAVYMTPKGTLLFEKMAKDHAKWISEMLGDMPKDQQKTLLENLLSLQSTLT